MKVRFTPGARAGFLAAMEYIRRDRPMAAARFRHKCEETLRRLESFPESGRQIPEFPDLPYRELIVPPYRFFYKLAGETVWIVGVWHDAQLPWAPDADVFPR